MDASLDGCYAKLERAGELVSTLMTESSAWAETDAAFITYDREWRPDTREYVIKAKINEAPPTRWGVLVGELAHNCRSSLDQFLFQLLILRGHRPSEDDRSFQFVIAESPDQFRKEAERRLQDLPREDVERLEHFQPYVERDDRSWPPFHGEGPENHPLAHLHWLSNRDKHRLIQPAAAWFLAPPNWGIPPELNYVRNNEAGAIVEIVHEEALLSTDYTEIARLKLAPAGANPIVAPAAVHRGITFTERHLALIGELTLMHQACREILDNFKPDFEGTGTAQPASGGET